MHSARIALTAACLALGTPALTAAQTAPPVTTPPAKAASAASLATPEIKAFAAVHVAIATVHDSIDAQLAQSRNKTVQMQTQLQEKMRSLIAETLKKSGMTDAEYQKKRYLISTDTLARKSFDAVVAELTGAPTPGQVVVVAGPPLVAVPAGPAGVHLGHVVNSFMDTPDKAGLLPMAMTEARIAIQHATLGLRAPGNLSMMQLHAGHVINALNPTIVTAGPGKGYGVIRAATGVAMHAELATKSEGAGPNVLVQGPRVATAARSTVVRAEQIIKLAQQVQAATDAKVAATLMGEMVSMCGQLIAGADLNSDGRISWDGGEGGLQQAQESVTLALGTRD